LCFLQPHFGYFPLCFYQQILGWMGVLFCSNPLSLILLLMGFAFVKFDYVFFFIPRNVSLFLC
jgi:hypothetical protein